MGAVVVEECYERVGNRFRPSGPGGFKTRTDFVTKKLSETWWPRHLGFDDLLKLRRDKTGHRWVYRTALIQPEYGHGGNELERGFTIVWQFVEVPEDVTALIDS